MVIVKGPRSPPWASRGAYVLRSSRVVTAKRKSPYSIPARKLATAGSSPRSVTWTAVLRNSPTAPCQPGSVRVPTSAATTGLFAWVHLRAQGKGLALSGLRKRGLRRRVVQTRRAFEQADQVRGRSGGCGDTAQFNSPVSVAKAGQVHVGGNEFRQVLQEGHDPLLGRLVEHGDPL